MGKTLPKLATNEFLKLFPKWELDYEWTDVEIELIKLRFTGELKLDNNADVHDYIKEKYGIDKPLLYQYEYRIIDRLSRINNLNPEYVKTKLKKLKDINKTHEFIRAYPFWKYAPLTPEQEKAIIYCYGLDSGKSRSIRDAAKLIGKSYQKVGIDLQRAEEKIKQVHEGEVIVNPDHLEKFSALIKNYRKQHHLSQQEMAYKLGIGIGKYNYFEMGKRVKLTKEDLDIFFPIVGEEIYTISAIW